MCDDEHFDAALDVMLGSSSRMLGSSCNRRRIAQASRKKTVKLLNDLGGNRMTIILCTSTILKYIN